MRYIIVLLVLICFLTRAYSQKDNTSELYKEILKSQIDFEKKYNKFSTMNVVFKDKRYNSLDLSYEGISLNNLNSKELKTKSKKGIDIIEVYPIEVLGNRIRIETLSIFRRKKKITIYGKSSYYFKYDCNKKKFILVDKNQKMI